jgi:hypothetical protein
MYAVIQSDCAQAVREKTYRRGRGDEALFWETAAEACVALRTSNLDSWRRATETWFGGGRTYSERNCYVDTVRESLNAVMGSDPAPEALPDITLGPSASGYACPPSDLDLVPRTGTLETEVTLSWSGTPWMHESGDVFFGNGKVLTAVGQSDSSLTVRLPAHAPGTVEVVLRFDDGTEADFGSFTYE